MALFFDTQQPRRKHFVDRAREAGLPLQNMLHVLGRFNQKKIQKIKTIVNIHRKDHHDTFEELSILPCPFLSDVIIVSEEVPLRIKFPIINSLSGQVAGT